MLNSLVDGSTHKWFALVSKLAHCWTGPYKGLFAGPGKAPDGALVGENLLLLDMSHKNSRHINARVSVHICKRRYNPHEGERIPQFLPWVMNSYVLNKYSDLSPPFHLTADDVNMKMDLYRATPGSTVSHRIFRGFPETVSSPAGTNWKRLPGKQSKIWHSTAMWWSGGAPLGG